MVSETNAWDQFESGCRKLPDEALKGIGKRIRQVVRRRDFNAGGFLHGRKP